MPVGNTDLETRCSGVAKVLVAKLCVVLAWPLAIRCGTFARAASEGSSLTAAPRVLVVPCFRISIPSLSGLDTHTHTQTRARSHMHTTVRLSETSVQDRSVRQDPRAFAKHVSRSGKSIARAYIPGIRKTSRLDIVKLPFSDAAGDF